MDTEIDKAVALLRAAGWTVSEPITQENCSHPMHLVRGSGSIGADGSSHSESTCGRCGKHWEYSTPPRADRYPTAWIQNAAGG